MTPAFFSLTAALLVGLGVSSCNRLRPQPRTETVYVLAKETFLRDRVAAVSNRVGVVHNGDRLELLERDRRFLKVRTDKGETGWIEEHSVVNPEVIAGFAQLSQAQGKDPVVATGVLRDDGYLHLKPGRDTDRFYLLPENDKLQLLLRASVPKVVGPQASGSSTFASVPNGLKKAASRPSAAAQAKAAREKEEAKDAPAVVFHPPPPPAPPPDMLSSPESEPGDSAAKPASTPAAPPPPPAMEDWWLIRDSQGRVGWIMARRIDVDVPDAVGQYAEGQRMVAAYLLRKVFDPESSFPDQQAPEYVTVLNPYQDGLPYDFNQVRVFTWNVKKHRYETAFRQRNLQGYLPVVVASQAGDKGAADPTFQIAQGVGDSVTIDPDTGVARPTSTQLSTYVLIGDHVSKVEPGSAGVAPARAPSIAPEKPRRTNRKRSTRVQHRRGH